MLLSVNGVDDFVAATQLNFDDRVAQMSDTGVYLCRQTTVGSAAVSTAQLLHAQQQSLHLSAETMAHALSNAVTIDVYSPLR